MNSKLINSKSYNSKIRIYYHNTLDSKLAERIIECIWQNPELVNSEKDFRLVQETKAKVYWMEFDNQAYYLKYYSYRNTSKIIKNIVRSVDALRCFQTGIKLINAGIETAKPVLALTMKRNMFLTDSIFVAKEVPGVDLYTYLANNTNNPDLRKDLLKKIAIIWSKLVNNNFVHLDPWLGNFMAYPVQGDLKLELIDIDNIYSIPYLPQKLLLIKSLSKLRSKQSNSFAATQAEIDLFMEEFRPRCTTLNGSSGFNLALSHLIKKSQ